MVRKETPEQREYYKPFRCVAGYVLCVMVIMNALNMATSGISIAGRFIFENEILQDIFSSGVLYGSMILGYYLCYRIFFRKYIDRIYQRETIRKEKLLSLIPVCLGTFVYGLCCWQLWSLVPEVAYETEEGAIGLSGIIYACLGAPIMEELVFRYWIRKLMKPYGRWCYVLLSALAFGLFHGTWLQSVPAMFIGLAFGLIAWHYDSIVPTVLLHIANNTLSTVSAYYPIEISETLIYVITAVFLAIMFIVLFRKLRWKDFGKPFKLIPQSFSYIAFIVLYVLMIVGDVLIRHYFH
ncbi:MAG: CPBP family intramembrane metalloprotease [Erysipelotrichaceae bacterium]|nr:CPBP family intramembrane metalloprotease [Erysipelotrichaceae bacterium]